MTRNRNDAIGTSGAGDEAAADGFLEVRAQSTGLRRASGQIPRVAVRDGLLGGLAHELRTELALVLGPLEDALEDSDDPLGPAQEGRVRGAHGHGLRLARIVDDLLEGAPGPKVPLPRTAKALEPAPERAPASDLITVVRGRVLIADDHADMRAYLKELLGRHHDVEVHEDGASALTSALARPPDLVLSDIAMPALDGISLVRALRANEATRATSVVLVSAEGDEARARGLDAGADDYVRKPFSSRELSARVAAHVATARVRRDSMRREAAARAEAERASKRAAEAELRLAAATEVERRFSLLAEATHGSCWELELTTGRVTMGAALQALTGYGVDEIEDPHLAWSERIPEEDRERTGRELEAVLASDARTWSTEYRFRRRDGELATVSSHALIDRDADGKAMKLVGVVLDVTEQRLAEARLCAIRRMEAVGILAAGVAHEVNNMMTAVIGYGELALERSTLHGESARRDVEEMVRAARRAWHVTGHLASFGRGPAELSGDVEVSAVLRDLRSMLRRLVGANVVVTLEAPPAAVRASVHRGHLEQAVAHIVLSARDAIPSGGRLSIRVDTRRVDPAPSPASPAPGRYVVLEIAETSPPGSEADRAAIGNAAGLTAAQGIVAQCGGFLEFEAEPGAALRVRLGLPASGAPEDDVAPEPVPDETILVVEDDDLVRRLTRRILEHAGYRVIEAVNGVAAFALASELRDTLALVVTDLVMPELGGKELKRILREQGIDVPLLFMSAYTGEHIARYSLLDADSRLLEKPFAAADLFREVRGAIGRDRSRNLLP